MKMQVETSGRGSLFAGWHHRIPALYTECSAASGAEARYLAGLHRLLLHLGMRAGGAPEPPAPRQHIEDVALGSGHVQGKSQAPVAGLFRPEMAVWDTVAAGALLGRVTDPFGQTVFECRAEEAGTLIMVSQLRRVTVGTALAVVAA
jgi:predicted deacylase